MVSVPVSRVSPTSECGVEYYTDGEVVTDADCC